MAYPSTFADLKTAVINLVRLDATNDASKVGDWINQVYADACVNTEANTKADYQMTLTAGTASYTLPSTVVRIKEMYVTPVGAIQSAPVRLTSLDDILTKRRASGGAILGGYITHYALLGINDLEVYPTPAAADVLHIWYVAQPTALSADGDTPILEEPFATRLLTYGAAALAAEWRGDPAGPEYDQKYQMWLQKYRGHLTRKMGGQAGQFQMYPGRQFPPHDPSTDVMGY